MPSEAEIGALIKGLRIQRELTQRKLAELVGTDPTYLSKVENARLGTHPGSPLLVALADVLEVDRDWLLTQCGRPPERMGEAIEEHPEFFQDLARRYDGDGETGRGRGGIRGLPEDYPRRTLRLVGNVNAGLPVEAIEGAEEFDLAERFSPEGHFLLTVRGESMIEEGIRDGDLAVVRAQADCDNGRIAVVLVDGQDATLKRVFREGPQVRLQPANAAMEPLTLAAERVEVRGVVVGVVRVEVR